MNRKRNWLLAIVLLIVFAGLLGRYLDRVPQRHYCDFRVYHHAAVRFLAGQDIYERDDMDITPFKYSPFFAFCFAPLGFLPIKIAAGLFFTFNVILTIMMYYLAASLFGLQKKLSSSKGLMTLLYTIGAVLMARFVFLVWDSGQVSILTTVLALLGLLFLQKANNPAAGAMMAASILIKYMAVLFLPYFLFRRQYKVVLWTIAFIAIDLLIPSLVVGVPKELGYLSSWLPSIVGTSLDPLSYVTSTNQSLISLCIRLFSDCGMGVNIAYLSFEQGKLLGYALCGALYVSLFFPAPGKTENQNIDYAMIFIFIPLFNPNGWDLNFVSLVVAYTLLLGYLIAFRSKYWWMGVFVVSSFALNSLMARGIVGGHLRAQGELYGTVTLSALLLLAALAKLKFCQKGKL